MNDASRLSDLARIAASGEADALDALARTFWPHAYRIAWSILGERGAAEDAAQTACAAMCAKISTLSDPDRFVAWSYRIVVSHARDHGRARGRLRQREIIGIEHASEKATTDDPSEHLDLAVAIDRLAEPLRLALELHYFFGLSSREIGIVLGIPSATVRFRLMMARRRLRPLLRDSTASYATPEVIV